MKTHTILFFFFAGIATLFSLSGCSDEETGACIVGSDITAGCTDVTEGNCNTLNGDWTSGTSCSELGFNGKAAVSTLVISEVFFEASTKGPVPGWIEILNANSETVDLTGFSLILGDAEGEFAKLELSGFIQGCDTYVIGGPKSNSANGFPKIDQLVDMGDLLKQSGRSVEFAALFKPAAKLTGDCPLAGIVFGDRHLAVLSGLGCTDCISLVGPVASGWSIERIAWPADTWARATSPYPNMISNVLGCTYTVERGGSLPHPVWR